MLCFFFIRPYVIDEELSAQSGKRGGQWQALRDDSHARANSDCPSVVLCDVLLVQQRGYLMYSRTYSRNRLVSRAAEVASLSPVLVP